MADFGVLIKERMNMKLFIAVLLMLASARGGIINPPTAAGSGGVPTNFASGGVTNLFGDMAGQTSADFLPSAYSAVSRVSFTNTAVGAYPVDIAIDPDHGHLGIWRHQPIPFSSGWANELLYFNIDSLGVTNRAGGLITRNGYGTLIYTTTNENYAQVADDNHVLAPIKVGALLLGPTNSLPTNSAVAIQAGLSYWNSLSNALLVVDTNLLQRSVITGNQLGTMAYKGEGSIITNAGVLVTGSATITNALTVGGNLFAWQHTPVKTWSVSGATISENGGLMYSPSINITTNVLHVLWYPLPPPVWNGETNITYDIGGYVQFAAVDVTNGIALFNVGLYGDKQGGATLSGASYATIAITNTLPQKSFYPFVATMTVSNVHMGGQIVIVPSAEQTRTNTVYFTNLKVRQRP